MSGVGGLTSGLHLLDSQKFSDEDIESDLASIPSSPKGIGTIEKPTREAVSKTASVLIGGLSDKILGGNDKTGEDEGCDNILDNTDDSEHESDADPAILANITAAATKRNLSHAAARHVDPDTADSTTAEMPSHPEILGRILKTLRPSDGDKPHVVPSLPSLERKVAQLHTDKKKRLSVPLPTVVSARIERSIAYKKARSGITDKWKDTVKHNRRADQLSFPMDDPQLFTSTTDLSSRPPSRRPGASQHELEIEQILREAGVDSNKRAEGAENAAVDDALSQGIISEEDVLRRRRELAQIRSLAFHYDQKMKRIKKIKSKKYRRIMKKERERLAEGDAAGNSDEEREEAVAAERRRVEERVTLRHKNTSKWIRRQLQRGEGKKDVETRAAIEEQLRVHEELKQRQQKEDGNDGSGDDDSQSDSEAGGVSYEDRLESLRKELEAEGPENEASEAKGVMGLRFMQAAMERKRQQALATVAEVQEDLHEKDDENEMPGPNLYLKPPHSVDIKTNGAESDSDGEHDGATYEAGSKDQEIDQLERRIRDKYDEDAASGLLRGRTDGAVDVDTAASVIKSTGNAPSIFTSRLEGRLTTDETNPWLKGVVFNSQPDSTDNAHKKSTAEPLAVKSTKKKRKVKVSADSEKRVAAIQNVVKSGPSDKNEALEKAAPTLLLTSKSIEETENRSKFDGGTEVKQNSKRRKKRNVSNSLSNNAAQRPKPKLAGTAQSDVERPSEVRSTPSNRPPKEFQAPVSSKKRKHLDRTDADDLEKMEGIAQAFAGAGGADLDEFEAAKQADIEESLPTAKSVHAEVLPGWGQWHGAGMSEDAKKRAEETPFARAARERLAAARSTAVHSRSDRNMRNVILEQKRYQSATKLTVGCVPYPFRTREQWERELSRPLCREFVSNKAFRTGVERRVETKLGKVINPIIAPLPTPESTSKQDSLVSRGPGKKAVIDLRKQKASHRVNSRRNFLS